MCRNVQGRPLCKHARAVDQGNSFTGEWDCSWWCEYRTAFYKVVIPALLIIGLIYGLVPSGYASGFQAPYCCSAQVNP